MKEQIEKLKSLCKEMAQWGTELGLSQTHNKVSPGINIYFANNYKTWSVTIGFENYTPERNTFEYTSYTGAISIGENTTTELLEALLSDCINEFERLKTEDFYNLKNRAEKQRKERIDSLKKELSDLENRK